MKSTKEILAKIFISNEDSEKLFIKQLELMKYFTQEQIEEKLAKWIELSKTIPNYQNVALLDATIRACEWILDEDYIVIN